MKTGIITFFTGVFASVAAFAANEGVPSYYQTSQTNANQAGYSQYQAQGYTKYVGQSGDKQIVGSRTYSYQVPRQTVVQPTYTGTMTANGISGADTARTTIMPTYARRFANFEFETGVNSILKWDDMVFNEFGVTAQHNFSLRNFDMFAFAEYSYGQMASGGLSMDYDLKPFDESEPNRGIFTISVGDESGRTNHFRFGIGAHHVWDIGGWKLSPSFGYEIFKHNLEMSDHYYPNPGVYLPLMTDKGAYVYGDADGNYYSVPVGTEVSDDWYQVCMSPEDLKVVPASSNGTIFKLPDTSLPTIDYNSSWGTVPWGVDAGECVIIGGDGPIIVEGKTHEYNTTWSGFYIGLEVEKQMTLSDKLRFYIQFGMPKYSSEGIWPNRTDWQQNPSFLDEGSNGAYSYQAEMEYNMRVSDRLQLVLRADTNYFYVGKIGGELYHAESSYYEQQEDGSWVVVTEAAYTEKISDQLKHATWQSFGLHLGLKYAF